MLKTARRRARLLMMFAPAAVAGCVRHAPSVNATGVAEIDTAFYISVRARENGHDTRLLADSLEFGAVFSSVKRNGDALTNNVRVVPVDSVRFTATEFASVLAARAAAAAGDSIAVLMVHGFGTSLHEAWDYASQAHLRSRSRAPWVVFCWPSNGAGIAWPRANQILDRAYREDSAAAAASGKAFAQATQIVSQAVGARHLVLIAHSLGAQLVGESFAFNSELRTAFAQNPLRVLAFFAPDVATEHFDSVILPAATQLATRTVIYASSSDRLLTFSRAINKGERAGLIGTVPPAHPGAETVDATDGVAAESSMQHIFGTHHTIRRASAALFDLLHLVAGQYPPTCRTTLGTATLERSGVWKLTSIAPPALSALAACSR